MVTYILPLRAVGCSDWQNFLLFVVLSYYYFHKYFKPSNFTIFLAGYEERRGNNRHPKRRWWLVGGHIPRNWQNRLVSIKLCLGNQRCDTNFRLRYKLITCFHEFSVYKNCSRNFNFLYFLLLRGRSFPLKTKQTKKNPM